MQLEDFGRDQVAHPDPGIDLCALPYSVVDDALRAVGRGVYETFFESSQVIPPDDTATLRISIPNGAFECQTTTVSPMQPGDSAYP